GQQVAEHLAGLLRALPFLDQFGRHVLDTEPDRPQPALPRQGHEVGAAVDVVFRALGTDPDGVAEGPTAHRAARHRREDRLGGLMVIEEVIIRSEEAVDARCLDNSGDLLDQPCVMMIAMTLANLPRRLTGTGRASSEDMR